MRLSFVMVATLSVLTACREDPILARARADAEARDAEAAPAAPTAGEAGAPPPGGAPGEAAVTPGDPSVPPPGGAPGVGAPTPGSPGEPEKGDPSQPSPTGRGIPVEPAPAPEGAPGGGVPGNPGVPPPGGKPGGPPMILGPTVQVTGTVVYAAWKAGVVRIDAFDGDHTRHGAQPGVVASTKIDRPGAFTVDVPQGAGKLYFEAVVDEDRDGKPGPLDPSGVAERYPVTVGDSSVSGLTIQLTRREPPPGGGKGKDY